MLPFLLWDDPMPMCSFLFVHRQLGGPGQVPSDGPQEGARNFRGDRAGVCLRQNQPSGWHGGVCIWSQPCQHHSGGVCEDNRWFFLGSDWSCAVAMSESKRWFLGDSCPDGYFSVKGAKGVRGDLPCFDWSFCKWFAVLWSVEVISVKGDSVLERPF